MSITVTSSLPEPDKLPRSVTIVCPKGRNEELGIQELRPPKS